MVAILMLVVLFFGAVYLGRPGVYLPILLVMLFGGLPRRDSLRRGRRSFALVTRFADWYEMDGTLPVPVYPARLPGADAGGRRMVITVPTTGFPPRQEGHYPHGEFYQQQ